MRKILLFLVVCSLMIPACARKPRTEHTVQSDIVDRELTRSRAEILSQLSELQAVSRPAPPVLPATSTAPYDLSYPAKLFWEGPVEQGLASLGRIIGWQARRFGPAPVHDVMVYCDSTDTGFEIIQKFQSQIGSRGRIIIDESNRMLKLVYGSDIAPEYRRRSARHSRRARPAAHRPKPKQALPSVPSSHKPALQEPKPAVQPAPAPQATPAPAPTSEQKVESDVILRARPHQEGSAAMIDEVLGRK